MCAPSGCVHGECVCAKVNVYISQVCVFITVYLFYKVEIQSVL